MLIIPAISLKDGQCVRLTQGRKSDVKVYDGDPVEIAGGFEAAVAASTALSSARRSTKDALPYRKHYA